jgi:hypothetical protein
LGLQRTAGKRRSWRQTFTRVLTRRVRLTRQRPQVELRLVPNPKPLEPGADVS